MLTPVPRAGEQSHDVVIVGGLGHVGLPLGLVLADQGLRVCLYDTDTRHFDRVRRGVMPFIEHGAEPILRRVIGRTLFLSSDVRQVATARHVVIAIGTPVDEHLNPNFRPLFALFETLRPYLDPAQTIIVRSTVYPGTCRQLHELLARDGRTWHVAYCPERIAQGQAVRELGVLPQLVAGLSEQAAADAAALFGRISARVIQVSMAEAELAKLFSNAWRYIQFAVANQFHMIADGFGVDFHRVRQAMQDGYGRAATLPSAGFAAGPCLLKDTLQLAAFNTTFVLGHAAMAINEGVPNAIVERLRQRRDLARTRVGILGMAFKADIDDTRDSLSYKLGKLLRFHGATVRYSDEYAEDPTFIGKEELIASSDVVVVGVPHAAYHGLRLPARVEVVDLWGVVGPPQEDRQDGSRRRHTRARTGILGSTVIHLDP